MKFLMVILMLFTVLCQGKEKITLDGDNFFAVNMPFTDVLQEKFTKRIMTSEAKEMYIYFDSPGGDIYALTRMLEVMKTSKIKFICVARFAASAAFMMFEHCQERYILPDGILMSHNASLGVQDELPRIKSFLNMMISTIDNLEKSVAKIMNLSIEEYTRLINMNLWMDPILARKYNAIDDVIDGVQCSKELVNKVEMRTVVTFSMVGLQVKEFNFSACPLLRLPVQLEENSSEEPVQSQKGITKKTEVKPIVEIGDPRKTRFNFEGGVIYGR